MIISAIVLIYMGNKNEIRKHYYLDELVVFAPKRIKRPTSFTEHLECVESQESCVFCDNTEKATFALHDDEGWTIKAMPNFNPLFSLLEDESYGYQELILDARNHITTMSKLGIEGIRSLYNVYAQRITAVKQIPHIKYVAIVKNNGGHSGATKNHAHSQLYALPFTPPLIDAEITALKAYKQKHKACAICHIVETEISDDVRVIYETSTIIAIAPYASIFPYEVWIIPKTHVTHFGKNSSATLGDMASITYATTNYIENKLLDYNVIVHDVHNNIGHSYVKIIPRVAAPKVFGGLELSSGIFVNSILPEQAAVEIQEHARSLLPVRHYATVG